MDMLPTLDAPLPKIATLSVGQTASYTQRVGDDEIERFADVSGDVNPVHLDEDYAARTIFQGRIAHGMLSASFISNVLGNQLPGAGSIYLSQTLKFKAPVRPGDEVIATATITDIVAAKKRVTLATVCRVGDTVVLEGEATLLVP